MKINTDEVKNVLEKHDYKIHSMTFDVMKKFGFKTLCCRTGMTKNCGFSVSEIIALMIIFPLMLLKSVH